MLVALALQIDFWVELAKLRRSRYQEVKFCRGGPVGPVWGRPSSLCCVLSFLVQHSIQKSVRTLWQQLVAQRRQTLEDTFKIDLSVKAGESEVKIEEVTPLWEETMLRAWQHYLGLCPLKPRSKTC